MITIDNVDFSKLKPYDGKVTKCFEQLCYQIVQKEFGHLGIFTPIDGSGGDGGVEFYLNLTNGEKWGWQCKFFGDTGRLNVGNRKTQIANSLETACRNHGNLTKWFLCIKTDLTEDSKAADGTISKGEQNWFKNDLVKKIPAGRSIILEHWGESAFITFLRESKHIGIRSFFFGSLEFDSDWFNKKFQENFEKVKDKYDAELHSIDKYTQSKIDFILFNSSYINQLAELKRELLDKSNQIESSISEFRDEKMLSVKEKVQRDNYVLFCNEFKKHIGLVFEKIQFIENCFKSFNEEQLSTFKLQELNDDFFQYFDKIDHSVFDEKSRATKDASEISYLISDFGDLYNNFFSNYFHNSQKEIHFIADAAKGKTHLSCDIAFKSISCGNPAIFLTGDKFTDETSIIEAIKKCLDINQSFSFDDFLEALDIYGSIIKSKIPIIIDGLNETTFNRLFSPIWKKHLSSFISQVTKTKNIIVVTTCRNSYLNRIWDNPEKKKFSYLYGFRDYETVHEAVTKYFVKYKIKADLFFASLDKFKEPIFLKIFCEIKNPLSNVHNEIEVNVEEDSTFDIFDEYLKQVNKKITRDNHLFKENEPFIQQSLSTLSNYLWNNNLREIPVHIFYTLIDGTKTYQKDTSKADILIHEGLVVTRDMRNVEEYVSFTYDILAGYMIGQYLIQSNKTLTYYTSNKFIQKISQENGQHPFYEDIISSLALLLPQLKQTSLHELINSDKKLEFSQNKLFKYLPKFIKNTFSRRISYSNYAFSISLNSMFNWPSNLVKSEDVNMVKHLFENSSNKEVFFNLCFTTLSETKHPLNAQFLYQLLASMKMGERDITWTEYIRKKNNDLESFIKDFETQCKRVGEESVIIVEKQHVLANAIVWFLTSSNRALRDNATLALYHYGRKFPKNFSFLVYVSLQINDPYVWERTLAALYGVIMAKHNEVGNDKFRNETLPQISKTLYDLIFCETAPHSTTHILARDYARRTIEISLLHNPTSLTVDEIKNIRPPYSFGGIRILKEYDYGEREYDFSGPMRMDFSNYTLGHIVIDGHSYANPPEKIKVRKQIYCRIYDLGWNEELFKNAETSLGNDSYYKRGRTEKAKTDRYGKKYSWIAYFENAGLRNDLGLLDKDWDRFRISDADIDPSFPLKPENKKYIIDDLLGDRTTPLVEWYENGGMPFLENYLSVNNLNGERGDWICLDSFSNQQDVQEERQRFTFIRSLIIKEDEYAEVIELLNNQNIGGRWVPEKNENFYTFAGELYYCKDSTEDNWTTIEFVTAKKKIKIKRGEAGYYPSVFWEEDNDNVEIKKEFPDEIEREVSEVKEFDVLLPVMEYSWESHHSYLNEAGHTTVLAKEIVTDLCLIDQPQTFDICELNGNKASMNIYYHSDYNNNHTFVYLRKDLLNKFLEQNKLKFVWTIWGERDVTFQTNEKRHDFFTTHPFKQHQVFQKIIEYIK